MVPRRDLRVKGQIQERIVFQRVKIGDQEVQTHDLCCIAASESSVTMACCDREQPWICLATAIVDGGIVLSWKATVSARSKVRRYRRLCVRDPYRAQAT